MVRPGLTLDRKVCGKLFGLLRASVRLSLWTESFFVNFSDCSERSFLMSAEAYERANYVVVQIKHIRDQGGWQEFEGPVCNLLLIISLFPQALCLTSKSCTY